METDNKALVQRYLRDVWEDGDPAAVTRFLAESYRRHLSPTGAPLDLAGQVDRLTKLRSAFPDARVIAEDLLAEGDRVALRGMLRGTHRGEFMGIAPTGREVTVAVVDVLRIEDGRIAEHWGGPDLFDLLQQLGAAFAPPG